MDVLVVPLTITCGKGLNVESTNARQPNSNTKVAIERPRASLCDPEDAFEWTQLQYANQGCAKEDTGFHACRHNARASKLGAKTCG